MTIHATWSDDQIWFSAPGGPEKEAIQTLRVIEASLKACGATLEHVTMVHAWSLTKGKLLQKIWTNTDNQWVEKLVV